MKNNNEKWITSDAQWISLTGHEETQNLYLQFARVFDMTDPTPLTIDITAVSQYALWVNGRYLGRGPAVADRRHYYYDTYTVPAEHVHQGANKIAVLLYHDGTGTDPLLQDTGIVQGFEYGQPGLLVHAHGTEINLVSDASWRVKQSEVYTGRSRVSRWGGYKEFYHADREQPWQSLEFNCDAWSPAMTVAQAISTDHVQNLAPLDLPPLEQTKLSPQRIVSVEANLGTVDAGTPQLPTDYRDGAITFAPGEYGACPAVTLDFGDMVVGYPEIELAGGTCIYEVSYGETLDLYRLDVINNVADGTWRGFQRRAFRYLKIKFIVLSGQVTLRRLRLHNTWYAYHDNSHAVSSDDVFNRVMDVSKHTLRMNSSYHYEDCPHREQALWIFDMRAMALINYYYYGNPELVAKNLRQCFALQEDDGVVSSTGPKKNTCYHLDFCMHLIAAVKEYYQHSGDRDLLIELLPYVEKLADFIATFRDRSGILDSTAHHKGATSRDADGVLDSSLHDKGTPFLDWSDKIDKIGKSVILNAVYSRYLQDLAFIYDTCAHPDDTLLTERRQHRTAVNDLLFDEATGLYHDSHFEGKLSEKASFQGNMAALYAGFADGSTADNILVQMQDSKRFPPPFAPSFYLMVFEALAQLGRYDTIIDHIKRYWGGMLDRAATTWWEVFDPDSPHGHYPHPFLRNNATYEMDWIPISSCHGWSGTCSHVIIKYLLGIDLSDLYRNVITVRPAPGGYFDTFTYKLPIRKELLHLEFTAAGDRYDIDVRQKPAAIDLQLA